MVSKYCRYVNTGGIQSPRSRRIARVDAREVAPGLWRWTAPHPDWRPDPEPESAADWPEDVGCVLYLASDGAAVFVDPQLPPDVDEFWRWADERVGTRSVLVLTTIPWHERSRDAVARHYGASLAGDHDLPHGVELLPFPRADETMVWLPARRALVPGDRIIGTESGGLRLCPESWLRYLPSGMALEELREELGSLLAHPVERVLVSHGEPVLAGGGEALKRLLA
jgi:hypothetical protein